MVAVSHLLAVTRVLGAS